LQRAEFQLALFCVAGVLVSWPHLMGQLRGSLWRGVLLHVGIWATVVALGFVCSRGVSEPGPDESADREGDGA
jgi:hypothetical protein